MRVSRFRNQDLDRHIHTRGSRRLPRDRVSERRLLVFWDVRLPCLPSVHFSVREGDRRLDVGVGRVLDARLGGRRGTDMRGVELCEKGQGDQTA